VESTVGENLEPVKMVKRSWMKMILCMIVKMRFVDFKIITFNEIKKI
jgi:hypothetical protein